MANTTIIRPFIHYLSLTSPLKLIFTWLTPPRPYRATNCRERELTLDHDTFLTTEGLGGFSSMSRPPPRQHEHERRYTPFTHTLILTRRIWKHDDGQMKFGDRMGLKLPDICLTGEKISRKNLSQETCPDRWSNLGPLRDRRACYRLLHSSGPPVLIKYKRCSI